MAISGGEHSSEVFPSVVTGEFFSTYKPELREVFSILDIEDQWTENLDDLVEQTQPWARGDHSRPELALVFTPEQMDELMPLYDRMGMVREKPLPAGHYDEIVNLGAIHRGNNRRLNFLRRMLEGEVTTDRVMLLGGQRRPYEEVEKEDVESNVVELRARGSAPKWAKDFTERPLGSRWETDLMRLASYAQLGDVALKRLHVTLGDPDPIQAYDFVWRDTPVTLTHSRAVQRPNGEPRHTTESCIRDWVQEYSPEHGATVGFIGANPHLDRMVRSAQAQLHELGREDITLVGGGSAAPTDIKSSIYLGEIARNLYEDQRLLRNAGT